MNGSLANISLICEALQIALQIATGTGQNAARSGPVAGPGTTPYTLVFVPPGGPIGPLQTGLTVPPLATAQGRAHLYLTQPDLVRQVEALLDETVETFGEHLEQLIASFEERPTQASPLELVATQLRDLAGIIDTAVVKAREDKEKFRQDLLKLQDKLKLL
ncbi:hypothetical protein UFOVP1254_56 [uncultured Caudovirales phage]|uniref:Uncharacterized protein n=1 Tax=uncultured Caudovirales phage TaxID=2100421 RepID=A0A6J5RA36_9CAUD|nr:hypothetical protein UFOVP1254_56 [uncultured Caudovirales phage]